MQIQTQPAMLPPLIYVLTIQTDHVSYVRSGKLSFSIIPITILIKFEQIKVFTEPSAYRNQYRAFGQLDELLQDSAPKKSLILAKVLSRKHQFRFWTGN